MTERRHGGRAVEVDDADAALGMIDAFLECRHWLAQAEQAVPSLDETIPPNGAWQTIFGTIARVVELVKGFDALGLGVYEAEHTARRQLLLDIGGTLRLEVAERLRDVYLAMAEAAKLWGFAAPRIDDDWLAD